MTKERSLNISMNAYIIAMDLLSKVIINLLSSRLVIQSVEDFDTEPMPWAAGGGLVVAVRW